MKVETMQFIWAFNMALSLIVLILSSINLYKSKKLFIKSMEDYRKAQRYLFDVKALLLKVEQEGQEEKE